MCSISCYIVETRPYSVTTQLEFVGCITSAIGAHTISQSEVRGQSLKRFCKFVPFSLRNCRTKYIIREGCGTFGLRHVEFVRTTTVKVPCAGMDGVPDLPAHADDDNDGQ
jgi:hypothetical protein